MMYHYESKGPKKTMVQSYVCDRIRVAHQLSCSLLLSTTVME